MSRAGTHPTVGSGARPDVIRSTTPRLRVFAVAAVLGLVGGLAAGRPELVAVAAPFVILLAVGLAVSHDLEVNIDVSLDRDRAIEGEEIMLVISASTDPAESRLDFELDVPRGVEIDSAAGDGGLRRVADTVDALVRGATDIDGPDEVCNPGIRSGISRISSTVTVPLALAAEQKQAKQYERNARRRFLSHCIYPGR